MLCREDLFVKHVAGVAASFLKNFIEAAIDQLEGALDHAGELSVELPLQERVLIYLNLATLCLSLKLFH